ncbi:unnamed protein product [Ixodes pacificus]
MVVVPGISSLKTVPLPSTNQMTINIYLTEVVTCGHFYAHYSDPAYEAAEQHMTLAINHNGGKHLKPITSELRLEMLVLAPFKGAYYRARIESLGQNNKASVFFVDYGNRLILDASLLREIDPDTLFDALITPAQVSTRRTALLLSANAIASSGKRPTTDGHEGTGFKLLVVPPMPLPPSGWSSWKLPRLELRAEILLRRRPTERN